MKVVEELCHCHFLPTDHDNKYQGKFTDIVTASQFNLLGKEIPMRTNKTLLNVLALIVIVSFLFSACAANRPQWYLNPPESDNVIYGTGASEKTESLTLGKQVADANARTDLASTIQVSVQSMVRTFLQQSGTMEEVRALQFSEAVSKNVVDVQLTGVRISRREEIGDIYYSLAEISMDSVKNALLTAVRNAAAEYSELKAKQAFEDLNKEINRGNIPIIKE